MVQEVDDGALHLYHQHMEKDPQKCCSNVICVYLGRTSWGWKSFATTLQWILDQIGWNLEGELCFEIDITTLNMLMKAIRHIWMILDVDVHPLFKIVFIFHESAGWLALSTCRKQQRNLPWAHWRSWSSSTVLGWLVGGRFSSVAFGMVSLESPPPTQPAPESSSSSWRVQSSSIWPEAACHPAPIPAKTQICLPKKIQKVGEQIQYSA